MGSSAWDDKSYSSRSFARADTAAKLGKSVADTTFAYHADLRDSGKPLTVHEKLDPKSVNKNGAHKGQNIREALDSDAHPESLAIGVFFDVTGSMATVPIILQEKLPKLMGLLIRKGYVEHPQVLFGMIGDATCDKVPLQVGQFESGLEMDDDLTNAILERGGGAHTTESYELAMYFMARHTYIDCLEKRGKKGYLFFIGDETPYPRIDKHQVEELIGDKLQDNIETADLVNELKEKFECFYIMPKGTNHYGRDYVINPWKALFGQNVLMLDDPTLVCELIASTIGICEEKTSLDGVVSDLIDAGTDKAAAKATSKALVPIVGDRAPAVAGKVSGGTLVGATSGEEESGRL